MNSRTSMVPAGSAKWNLPRYIKIVKWFYSNFRLFSGEHLVKVNRSVVRPESFATVARAVSYTAQKGDEKAASSFQLPSKTGRRAAPTASLQSKTERASACGN